MGLDVSDGADGVAQDGQSVALLIISRTAFVFVSLRFTPNWLGIVVALLLYICFLSIFPAASLRFLCRSIDDEMTCKTSMPIVCVFSIDL